MECLQRLPLIHRDLAARNIMVAAFPIDDPSGSDAAQNVDVKVSDFGLSKYGGRERESPSTGETKCKDKEKIKDEEARPLRYMAPETFAVPPAFSEKSDVWAFGVLVWEVLDSCKTWAPYGDVTDDDAVVTGVVSGTLKLSRPKKASKALWRIAQSCMQRDPEQRPRFVDLAKTLEGLRATIQ
jgi:serine/threonine protein kinase